MQKRILFVDDSPTQRALWAHYLGAHGIAAAEAPADAAAELHLAATPLIALEILRDHAIDYVVTDVDMPDLTGWELIERAQPVRPGLEFIVVSSQVTTGQAPNTGDPARVHVFSKQDRDQAQAKLLALLAAHA